jgi:hypothetical protein
VPGAAAANEVVNRAGDVVEMASGVLEAYNPKNLIEAWAVAAAQSSAEFLAKIQEMLLELSQPDFTSGWFTKQYGVTFGIGMVLMVFAMMAAITRVGRGGPEALAVLRDSSISAVLYVPAVLVTPFLLSTLSEAAYALAAWFGQDATANASSAVQWYVQALAEMKNPADGLVGGVLSLLLLAGMTFLAGLLSLIELTIASYGQYIVTLLLPAIGALAIYPPWRHLARRLLGLLAGLMLTPVVLFLAFWVMWGAAAGLGQLQPGADRFTGMLMVAVAAVVAALAPLALGHFLPMFGAGDASTAHAALSSGATRGTTDFARAQSARLRRLTATRGGGAGGGGGGAVVPVAMAAAGGPTGWASVAASGAKAASGSGSGRPSRPAPPSGGGSSPSPQRRPSSSSARSGDGTPPAPVKPIPSNRPSGGRPVRPSSAPRPTPGNAPARPAPPAQPTVRRTPPVDRRDRPPTRDGSR